MKTLIAFIVLLSGTVAFAQPRPNVLFIIVDDLNDMPLHPDGKPLVPTPNFDRLAARGVSFTNAHCNDPICAPSRSSMMTGLYPQTSSLYWFEDYRQNAVLSQSMTLTEHLATNGYDVYSVGKIYHGNQDPKGFYADRGPGGNIGPWPWDGTKATRRGLIPHPQQMYLFADDADPDMDYQWEHTFGPLTMIPDYPADPEQNVPGYRGWRLSGKPWRYVSDNDRDPMPDETNASWAAGILDRKQERPFALFTGFSRTHTPLYAPQNYFDKFPLDKIVVPACYRDGDLEDCAPSLANRSLYAFRRYHMLFKHEDRPMLYKRWLQAYMACVAFIDDQVGTVLDALEASGQADETVVFLTSDHGFHVGGKEALYKQTLWDSGTRIPFIVAGLDGMSKGVTCDQPISLI
ncbi:MAG: sulfatase-like hydrolase/transferase, partial [Planctomycetota bacterium]